MGISCGAAEFALKSYFFVNPWGRGAPVCVRACVRGKECRTLRGSECRTRELELPAVIHSRMSDAKKYRFPSAVIYPDQWNSMFKLFINCWSVTNGQRVNI